MVLACVSACGKKGSYASARVGPAGGELAFRDARVVVPPGALDTVVELRVSVSTATPTAPYAPEGLVYRFEPSGIRFAKPVSVVLPLTGDPRTATIFWQRAGTSEFDPLPIVEVEGATLRGEVLHFTDGFTADAMKYWTDVFAEMADVVKEVHRRSEQAGGRVFPKWGIEVHKAMEDAFLKLEQRGVLQRVDKPHLLDGTEGHVFRSLDWNGKDTGFEFVVEREFVDPVGKTYRPDVVMTDLENRRIVVSDITTRALDDPSLFHPDGEPRRPRRDREKERWNARTPLDHVENHEMKSLAYKRNLEDALKRKGHGDFLVAAQTPRGGYYITNANEQHRVRPRGGRQSGSSNVAALVGSLGVMMLLQHLLDSPDDMAGEARVVLLRMVDAYMQGDVTTGDHLRKQWGGLEGSPEGTLALFYCKELADETAMVLKCVELMDRKIAALREKAIRWRAEEREAAAAAQAAPRPSSVRFAELAADEWIELGARTPPSFACIGSELELGASLLAQRDGYFVRVTGATVRAQWQGSPQGITLAESRSEPGTYGGKLVAPATSGPHVVVLTVQGRDLRREVRVRVYTYRLSAEDATERPPANGTSPAKRHFRVERLVGQGDAAMAYSPGAFWKDFDEIGFTGAHLQGNTQPADYTSFPVVTPDRDQGGFDLYAVSTREGTHRYRGTLRGGRFRNRVADLGSFDFSFGGDSPRLELVWGPDTGGAISGTVADLGEIAIGAAEGPILDIRAVRDPHGTASPVEATSVRLTIDPVGAVQLPGTLATDASGRALSNGAPLRASGAREGVIRIEVSAEDALAPLVAKARGVADPACPNGVAGDLAAGELLLYEQAIAALYQGGASSIQRRFDVPTLARLGFLSELRGGGFYGRHRARMRTHIDRLRPGTCADPGTIATLRAGYQRFRQAHTDIVYILDELVALDQAQVAGPVRDAVSARLRQYVDENFF